MCRQWPVAMCFFPKVLQSDRSIQSSIHRFCAAERVVFPCHESKYHCHHFIHPPPLAPAHLPPLPLPVHALPTVRWAELWTETENFNAWQSAHRLDATAVQDSLARTRSGNWDSGNGQPSASSSSLSLLSSSAAGASGSYSNVSGGGGGNDKTGKNLHAPNGGSALAGWETSQGGLLTAGGGVGAGGVCGGGPPRSGVRAFTYNSGDTYTGSWRNGRRHGIGVYEERATGNTYEVCSCCCVSCECVCAGGWVDGCLFPNPVSFSLCLYTCECKCVRAYVCVSSVVCFLSAHTFTRFVNGGLYFVHHQKICRRKICGARRILFAFRFPWVHPLGAWGGVPEKSKWTG